MSDNKEADKSLDRFSEYMQKRLANHRLPVDENGWAEVEAKMRKRHRSNLWKASIWMVAAAVVVLVFMRIQWSNPLEIDPVSPAFSLALDDADIPTALPDSSHIDEKKEDVLSIAPQESEVEQADEVMADAPEDKGIEEKEEKEEKKDTGAYAKENPAQPYRSRKERSPVPAKKKKENKWLIAASFGSGGGFSPGNLGGREDLVYDAIPDGDGAYITNPILPPQYDYILPEDFSDVTYSIPVSFGITVRKNLSKRMAVESGIVYTYLLTKFEKPAATRYDARLELHYLGIPLKLVTYLWNDPQWTVYGTAGVMGEKGLRSVYTQQRYAQEGIVTTTVSSAIRRMQWSLNGSIGASYRLYKEWSMYAEPRLSYYFESGQPVSTRTEYPLSFELGIGLRYEF
ncbi:MAG: PorT family protein [Tannerellaceae bacterium]|nr:PorT family protein [Tannerellaceae bacterium]